MGFYPDVAKGDKFRPIASLENDLRHMVNAMNGFRSGNDHAARNAARVTVINMTDKTLPVGTIVNLKKDGDPAMEAFSAVLFASVDEKWGILTETVDPMMYGACQISGVIEVPVTSDGDYVEPDTADSARKRFKPSENGGVRVISLKDQVAMIDLGERRSGGGSAEYSSYFKVIPGKIENGVLKSVKIIDGSEPESSYAGSTDLGRVSVGEVVIPSAASQVIYLAIIWTGTEYQQGFTTSTPSGGRVWELATVANGKITQRWMDGYINWGSRYFV